MGVAPTELEWLLTCFCYQHAAPTGAQTATDISLLMKAGQFKK